MTVHSAELTHEENYLLLELTYIDLNKGWLQEKGTGTNKLLVDVMETALADPSIKGERRSQLEDFSTKLATMPKLHDISIIAYENHNKFGAITGESENGFVGYALADSSGNRGILYRGTEWKDGVDMADNILSATTGTSPQVEYAKEFFDRYSTDQGYNSLFGHSKGGNVTGEVYVDRLGNNVKAYIVNGQPIYLDDLTDEQLAALRGENFTFIVHEGDIVSSLGEVDYIDYMVSTKDSWGFFDPHSLTSVAFNKNGEFLSSRPATQLDYMLQGSLKTRMLTALLGLGKGGLIAVGAQVVAQRYYYEISKWLTRISVAIAKKLDAIANYWKEQALTTISNMIQLSNEVKQKVNAWFNDAVQSVSTFIAQMSERFRGNAVGGLHTAHIEVRTAHLRDLALRLQRVQQKAQSVDSRLNELTYLARLDEKLAVAWIDIGFHYSSDIRRLVDYLNIAADNFDRSERKLLSEANTL
jgi:hypothetical protein